MNIKEKVTTNILGMLITLGIGAFAVIAWRWNIPATFAVLGWGLAIGMILSYLRERD